MLHLDHSPSVDASVFVAKSADVIGNVKIGKDSSIWFQCVLRADVMPITIGERSNVQDGSVIHGSLNKAETVIGNGVTIGHKVILHGCKIDDDVLIGMGSCVMDNAHIPKNSLVGAGSLVTENSSFEEGMLILGTPAKAVRPLNEKELSFIKSNSKHYIKYSDSYKNKKVNYYE